MARQRAPHQRRWVKLVGLLVVLLVIKSGFDYLSSEGNPMDTLAFKIRSTLSGAAYFNTIQPTSFQTIPIETPTQFSVNTTLFKVTTQEKMIQLGYFGDVVARAPLNQLLRSYHDAFTQQIKTALIKDAHRLMGTIPTASITDEMGVTLVITGEVAYFSKSLCSVRYRAHWEYDGHPDETRHQRGGIVLDLTNHRRMTLKDVLAYPYKDHMLRLWGVIEQELGIAGKNPSDYGLYTHDPSFYLSPMGLIVVNLSRQPEQEPLDIRIGYREHPSLFRAQGNLKHLVTP